MVLPTFVLLPLYIYPLANDYNWEFVTTALETYPSLQFTIIINPESGSGGNGSSYPVSDYIDGIANLTAYSNANLVGYVDTAYGDRSLSDVEIDIRTYDYWSTYTEKDIKISGLFFDDCVQSYAPTLFNYYSNITTFAHNTSILFNSFSPLIFNPGTLMDYEYFSLADNVVMSEESWASYESGTDTAISINSTLRSRSSIIINAFTGTAAEQASTVTSVVEAGVSGVFITTTDYGDVSSLWTQFVAAVGSELEET